MSEKGGGRLGMRGAPRGNPTARILARSPTPPDSSAPPDPSASACNGTCEMHAGRIGDGHPPPSTSPLRQPPLRRRPRWQLRSTR